MYQYWQGKEMFDYEFRPSLWQIHSSNKIGQCSYTQYYTHILIHLILISMLLITAHEKARHATVHLK